MPSPAPSYDFTGLGPDDLVDQFVLSPDPAHVPPGWGGRRIGSHYLGCHPAMSAAPITAAGDGRVLGYCLGPYLDAAFEVGGPLSLAAEPEVSEAAAEALVQGLIGRFVVILEVAGRLSVYLDPLGSRAVVYCPSLAMAATSSFLIPYTPETGDLDALIAEMAVGWKNSMYPVGTMPRAGLHRLLPNHRLDVAAGESLRYWPKEPLAGTLDPEEVVAEITEVMTRAVTAFGRAGPLQMSLTAGKDSRAVLACARQIADEVELFSWAIPDRSGALDCHMARKMARGEGLSHRIIETARADTAERNLWHYRTGLAGSAVRGIDGIPMVKRLSPERGYMPGVGFGLGKGYFQRQLGIGPDDPLDVLDPAMLVEIGTAPTTDAFVGAFRSWLDGLPVDRASEAIDLYFIEQRHGCWAGVTADGFAGMTAYEYWPFNAHRIVEAARSLPETYKRSGRLNEDIIARAWPELLRYPMNEADLGFKMRRVMNDPARILRKLTGRKAT